jgi:hypothetical protein
LAASGFALIVYASLIYALYYGSRFSIPAPEKSYSFLASFCWFWQILNLIGLWVFFYVSLGFISGKEQGLLKRYIARHILIPELEANIVDALWNSAEGNKTYAGAGSISSEKDQPAAVFSGPNFGSYGLFSNSGKTQVIVNLHHHSEVWDVNVHLLNWVNRRWLKRAKNDAKLIFSFAFNRSYEGALELCKVENGPNLTSLEKLVIRASIRYRKVRNDD